MKVLESDFRNLSEIYNTMCDAVGFEAAFKIAEIFEGEIIFFKRFESIYRKERNRKIKEDFNGYNFAALAKKYSLTTNAIREIVSDEIEKKRNGASVLTELNEKCSKIKGFRQ